MKMKITEKNYQMMISKRKYDQIIKQILQKYLHEYVRVLVIELRKKEDNISCYILNITPSIISEYATTKTFFQNIYKKK